MNCYQGKLNKQQKTAIREIVRQTTAEYETKWAENEALVTAYTAFAFFDLDEKTLFEFLEFYFQNYEDFKARYEMETLDDYEWYCNKRLRDKGIDVIGWFRKKTEEMRAKKEAQGKCE